MAPNWQNWKKKLFFHQISIHSLMYPCSPSFSPHSAHSCQRDVPGLSGKLNKQGQVWAPMKVRPREPADPSRQTSEAAGGIESHHLGLPHHSTSGHDQECQFPISSRLKQSRLQGPCRYWHPSSWGNRPSKGKGTQRPQITEQCSHTSAASSESRKMTQAEFRTPQFWIKGPGIS